VAAAFAQANAAATSAPDATSLSLLAELDSELPVIYKDRGRWVAVPLCLVRPR